MNRIKQFFKRKKPRNETECLKNCRECKHCVYLGYGDFFCRVIGYAVVDEWTPTDKFCFCKGENYETSKN